jgi:tetratricopeptide (TPR) repeat protein
MDLRMGRYSDAPHKYRKAVNYFISKGDKMTGIYLLKKIKDMNRANQKDLLNLSGLLVDQKMSEDAVDILSSLRAKLKSKPGNQKELEACLMMLHSLKKDDPSVLVELIETRIEMKEWERALTLLKKLLARDRKNISLLKRLAFIYKNMNDMSSYIKTFRLIANLYSEQGNLVYRNIYYHKILKHHPNDVEALSVLNMDDKLRENIDTKIENTDSKIKMIDIDS